MRERVTALVEFPAFQSIRLTNKYYFCARSKQNVAVTTNSHHKKDDIHQQSAKKAETPKAVNGDNAAAATGPSKTDEKVKEALKEARRLSAALEESKALTEKLQGEVRIAWETVEELSAAAK